MGALLSADQGRAARPTLWRSSCRKQVQSMLPACWQPHLARARFGFWSSQAGSQGAALLFVVRRTENPARNSIIILERTRAACSTAMPPAATAMAAETGSEDTALAVCASLTSASLFNADRGEPNEGESCRRMPCVIRGLTFADVLASEAALPSAVVVKPGFARSARTGTPFVGNVRLGKLLGSGVQARELTLP